MARLPDGSAFGALPSAFSNRPIATYDVSGYARGAAALAEGVSDLGKGISRAANGLEDQRSKSARMKLDQAKADGAYLMAKTQLRTALADESDPDAVTKSYPDQFRHAFAEAGSLIGDPQAREVWSLARSASRDGEVAASLDHAETLRRELEVANVTAQLQALRQSAQEMPHEADRAEIIGIGHGLISGLHNTGLVDEAQAKTLRESWTADYAATQLSRRPPEERIKLLAQGQGTIAEFIPEDRRAALSLAAQAEALDAQRKAQSDLALAQFTTRANLDDDLRQIQASGRGRDDVTPQQIDDTLGSEARRAWQAQRDDARTIWSLTHDLSTLTDEEIDARIASAAPKGDDAADSGGTPTVSARQQTIYDQVSERAAKLRELRTTDPAESVADDPNVRVAAEEFDPQRPETAKALIDARLAAQERAGIAEPSVITLAEVRDLLLPLARAVRDGASERGGNGGVPEQLQEQFVHRVEATYGPEAETVLDEIAQRVTAQTGGAFDADAATFGQGDDANGVLQNLILPVAGGPRGRGALLMAIITRGLRWVFSRKGNAPDEAPPQTPESPYPNNTNDPSQLVQPRVPEQPSSNPLDGKGVMVAAGAAAIEIQRRRMAAQHRAQRNELTAGNRDAFLADQPAQQELLRRTITEDFDQATSFVTDVAKTQGWTASTESLLAIRHYTGRAYQRLNRMMREGTATPDQQKLTALITRGIESLPQNAQEIWRAPEQVPEKAAEIWKNAKVGEDLDLGNQLQSFSSSREFAARWAGEGGLVIHIRAPTKGAFVEPISRYSGQSEVLLPPGLRYRVVSKDTAVWDGKSMQVMELEILK